MTLSSTSNPENLSKEEILALINVCPLCATPWPKDKYVCANRDCGVKLRVEPTAFNWWLFYPKCNG